GPDRRGEHCDGELLAHPEGGEDGGRREHGSPAGDTHDIPPVPAGRSPAQGGRVHGLAADGGDAGPQRLRDLRGREGGLNLLREGGRDQLRLRVIRPAASKWMKKTVPHGAAPVV